MKTNLEELKSSSLNKMKSGWTPKETPKSNVWDNSDDVLSSPDYSSRPELKELLEKFKSHRDKRNASVQKQEWQSASLERDFMQMTWRKILSLIQ